MGRPDNYAASLRMLQLGNVTRVREETDSAAVGIPQRTETDHPQISVADDGAAEQLTE